jgi:hypothetical protein
VDRGHAPRAASAARRGLALGKATRSARPMRASASSRLFRWPLPGRRAAGWAGAQPAGQARVNAAPPFTATVQVAPGGQARSWLGRRAASWACARGHRPALLQRPRSAGSRARASALCWAQAQPVASRQWWKQPERLARTCPERRGLALVAAWAGERQSVRRARGARGALALRPEADPLRHRDGDKVGALARQHEVRRAAQAALALPAQRRAPRPLLQHPGAAGSPARSARPAAERAGRRHGLPGTWLGRPGARGAVGRAPPACRPSCGRFARPSSAGGGAQAPAGLQRPRARCSLAGTRVSGSLMSSAPVCAAGGPHALGRLMRQLPGGLPAALEAGRALNAQSEAAGCYSCKEDSCNTARRCIGARTHRRELGDGVLGAVVCWNVCAHHKLLRAPAAQRPED